MSTVRHTTISTSLGDTTLIADGEVLVGCRFAADDTSTFGVHTAPHGDTLLGRAVDEIEEYLAGDRTVFDVPLRADGDDFDVKVWTAVRDVGYGQTITYGELAARLGDRFLAQRVGRALGQNPIGVFIPCHRVIGADGSLTGYAGGLDRKRRLLELEEPEHLRGWRLF
ncbi:methylated-DNA--[protein]-cysteine S-methyltransferase [Gordonia sp. OPL2]|uniref:methylated-DNA--[protein]-cysteine S-methyltransferase n=1 Tax=Gordonia sp. OPL2 TaxID=2486274 RepID=UPI0021CCD50B|nr:methylated-DNA--[protein]-cysteine S-methyltransferase [Gordonia sp. OPL2]